MSGSVESKIKLFHYIPPTANLESTITDGSSLLIEIIEEILIYKITESILNTQIKNYAIKVTTIETIEEEEQITEINYIYSNKRYNSKY